MSFDELVIWAMCIPAVIVPVWTSKHCTGVND
jgi:hypothetical protein